MNREGEEYHYIAAHVMSSELSQNDIVGATVRRYIKSITMKTARATMVFDFPVFTAGAASLIPDRTRSVVTQ